MRERSNRQAAAQASDQFGASSLPPDLDDLILSPAGDPLSIRRPVARVYLVGMSGQVHLELLRRDVPDLHRAVLRRRADEARVGRPADLVDRLDVRAERSDELAGDAVPQLHRLVEAGRRDVATVRREADAVDRLLVTGHAEDRLLLIHRVPQDQSEVIAAGDQKLLLRRGESLRVLLVTHSED